MSVVTRDPYSGKVLETFESDNQENALNKIRKSREAQKAWKASIDDRIGYFREVIKPNFEKNTDELATIMTEEMGKPISQSISEMCEAVVPAPAPR